jgi:hypothetical protein
MWLAAVAAAAVFALGCGSHGSERAAIGDGPEAAACPAYLDLEFFAKDSRFDPGWSGNTHGVGLATGSRLSVKVDECEPGCVRCRFHGPVRGDLTRTPVVNQRCLRNISKICAADGECGGEGPCRFVFPPIASQTSTTCTLAYFEPFKGGDPVQGVINLLTGEADMPVLNIQLSLHQNNCVNCIGDPIFADGMAGGVCEQTQVACDRHGTGTAVASATSFDCPPGPQITQIPLGTNGTSTSSVVWKMDATRPACTEKTAKDAMKRCWCGVCDDASPCASNKDCKTGTCGAANPPGTTTIAWRVANNSCPGKCNFDAATQRGTCAGTTTPCFPDDGEMVATGGTVVQEDLVISQRANFICMPSFNTGDPIGAFVDVVGGFPGPFLFEARFSVARRAGP